MTMRPRKLAIIVLFMAAAGAIVGATSYGGSRLGQEESTISVWEKVSWRAKLFGQKLFGEVPQFSWSELTQMTQRQGGLKLHVRIRVGGALEHRVAKRG